MKSIRSLSWDEIEECVRGQNMIIKIFEYEDTIYYYEVEIILGLGYKVLRNRKKEIVKISRLECVDFSFLRGNN